jgi:hypothetical protein
VQRVVTKEGTTAMALLAIRLHYVDERGKAAKEAKDRGGRGIHLR